MDRFLPYGRQQIDEDDIAAVARVLRSDFLSSGPSISAFEQAFAHQVGAADAVLVNSGTAALHLAALGAGLGPGQVAYVPAVTFVATANAMGFTGAQVVLCDVDPDTGLMTPETLAQARQRKPEGARDGAVVVVHLTGQVADMTALHAISQDVDAALIVDGCHALGSHYEGPSGKTQVGSGIWGEATCFSFHPVKTLAMGEGGAITTPDPEMGRRYRQWRGHGVERDAALFQRPERGVEDGHAAPWYHEFHKIGWNYRASDMQAALGLSQLAKLDRFTARRAALAELYDSLLAGLGDWIKPVGCATNQAPTYHLYSVLIDFAKIGMTRTELMTALNDQGIGTQVHYIPLHEQPVYGAGALDLPGATAYYERTLSLPLFPAMADDDPDRVVSVLRQIVEGG